jgi:hypothetical protein
LLERPRSETVETFPPGRFRFPCPSDFSPFLCSVVFVRKPLRWHCFNFESVCLQATNRGNHFIASLVVDRLSKPNVPDRNVRPLTLLPSAVRSVLVSERGL